MARKKKAKNVFKSIAISVITFILGLVSGFSCFTVANIESDKLPYSGSDLQIHFLELGNDNAGDCIYIKAGENDIIIDGGSKSNSITTIEEYIDKFVPDKTIEFVIVTHAHQDHYACYACKNSLFEYYTVDTLIDFAQTNNSASSLYKTYQSNIETAVGKGMKHYTAKDCMEGNNGAKSVYELASGITMRILNNKFYYEKSSDENNHSVCMLLTQGNNNYLFTGDLEKDGEEYLVSAEAGNNLPECVLFKAGHHGSKTSSNDVLLNVIKPKNVVVCCVAGSTEYTQNLDNTFPTQKFIDRVSKYTDAVYVTSQAKLVKQDGKWKNESYGSLNGVIVVYSDGNEVKFEFSNSDSKLKDSAWFKEYYAIPEVAAVRSIPENWK